MKLVEMGVELNRVRHQLVDFTIGPIDAIRLRTFELCFTVAFLIYMLGRFWYFREWLTPEGFHLSAEANLSYQIKPFPLLQKSEAIVVGGIIFGSGFLVLVNRFRRAGLAILFVAAVYVQHVDSISAFTLNKFYIVGFLFLVISPGLPSDLKLGLIRSGWAIRVLQATILIQFFTAGTCKLMHGDWHQFSDVLWSQVQGRYRTEIAAWLLRTLPKSAWAVMQHGALAFELLGPFLIAWRKTRTIGLIWASGFLLIITVTMGQLHFFTFQLAAMLILFVRAERLRKWGNMLEAFFSRKPKVES